MVVNRVSRNSHDEIAEPTGTPHPGPLDHRCFMRGCDSGEFGVKLSERFKAGAVVAEAQGQLPCAAHHAGGEIDKLLHHTAQPPALGRMADRGVLARQGAQPHPTQDVVGECAEGHD